MKHVLLLTTMFLSSYLVLAQADTILPPKTIISYPTLLARDIFKAGLELPIGLKSTITVSPMFASNVWNRNERLGFGADIMLRLVLNAVTFGKHTKYSSFVSAEASYWYDQIASWGWEFPDLRVHYIVNQVGFAWNFYGMRLEGRSLFLQTAFGIGIRQNYFSNYESFRMLTKEFDLVKATGAYFRTHLGIGIKLN